MATEEARLTVGQVLASRYWLQEHIGRGAMGDVFRAQHTKVARPFAVKVLHPHLLVDEKTCARFEREAELAGRLRHKNVVSVLDVGETSHTRYLVMEFAAGESLASILARGPLEAGRVIALLKQIADGLQHAHERELVHRDLKPENIIIEQVGEDEQPRIVDFGLAILRDGAGHDRGRLTTGGLVLGTPQYLAPEMATARPFDHRVDLFALGVILFEMLTGVLPYDGNGVDVAIANVRRPTPVMKLRAPDVTVDPLLEALTARLMAKDPADRPDTAREVRELLELIESDRDAAARALRVDLVPASAPVSPPPAIEEAIEEAIAPPPVETTTREMLRVAGRRSRIVVWATAALALALATGVVSVIALGGDPEAPATAAPASEDRPAPASAIASTESAPAVTDVVGQPAPAPVAARTPSSHRERPARPVTRAIELPVELAPEVPAEVSPPAEEPVVTADNVVELYRTVAAELKTIADRRDLSADDLWQRYRYIRLDDALRSNAKRAEALATLSEIQREIERRFR